MDVNKVDGLKTICDCKWICDVVFDEVKATTIVVNSLCRMFWHLQKKN